MTRYDQHNKGDQTSVYRVKYTLTGDQGSVSRFLDLKLATPDKGSDVMGLQLERDVLQVRPKPCLEARPTYAMRYPSKTIC